MVSWAVLGRTLIGDPSLLASTAGKHTWVICPVLGFPEEGPGHSGLSPAKGHKCLEHLSYKKRLKELG